jgi:hypothetical protein
VLSDGTASICVGLYNDDALDEYILIKFEINSF